MVKKYWLILMLVLMALVGQLSAVFYLPSLLDISRTLPASIREVQMTFALFLYGFAFAQLVYGPVSDAFGRKVSLLIGLVVCLLGSVTCYLSDNSLQLMVGRLLQGLGAGAGLAIGRAIVCDVYGHDHLAKSCSYLALTGVSLLMIVPLAGAYTLQYGDWRSIFFGLSVFTGLLLFLVYFTLPETNKEKALVKLSWAHIQPSVKSLLGSSVFTGNVRIIALVTGCIVAWLTCAPIVLRANGGLTSLQFGWVTLTMGGCYILGCLANGRVVESQGLPAMMRLGSFIMLASGLILLATCFIGFHWLVPIVAVACMMVGAGLLLPNAFAGALKPFAGTAGYATSLLGFAQVVGGGVMSHLISRIHDHSSLPLAVVVIVCSALTLLRPSER